MGTQDAVAMGPVQLLRHCTILFTNLIQPLIPLGKLIVLPVVFVILGTQEAHVLYVRNIPLISFCLSRNCHHICY